MADLGLRGRTGTMTAFGPLADLRARIALSAHSLDPEVVADRQQDQEDQDSGQRVLDETQGGDAVRNDR